MKLIDHILYLGFSDCIEAGISENTIKKANARKSPSWSFITDPTDKRKVLIQFECLKQEYKQQILSHFGNPYDKLSKEPIKNMIIRDLAAEKFYLTYSYNGNKKLTAEKVEAYTKAASFLNMLVKVEADKKAIKKLLNLTITEFWVKVCEIIHSDKIDLPTNIIRLRQKIDIYKADSYSSLIHKMYGQKNAAKVNDDLSQAILLELLSSDHQFDFNVVAQKYNSAVTEKGYKPITAQTAANWYKANAAQLSIYRNGNKSWYNTYGKVIHRQGPSAPMLLWSGDGNDWDMFFQSDRTTKTGGVEIYYTNLFVLVVVIDVYNRYPMGWAISEPNGEETVELIKAAYIDAIYHTKELTGNYYLPHQLQSDRFGATQLLPFFQKIDDQFFFAAARAPRGKYIESSFGTTWHKLLREYPNYSGNNVKAVTNINPERIAREKKNFPHTSEAFYYAQQFITSLRNIVDENSNGLTRQQVWINAFNQSDKAKLKQITTEQFLLKFGMYNTRQQTITNAGIQVQVGNTSYKYEIPEPLYLQTINRTVSLIHHPYEDNLVLVTDGENLRFIATAPTMTKAAKADYEEGDDARFFAKLHQKKRHMETIAAQKQQREKTLHQAGINVKAIQQSGTLDKRLKRAALLEGNQVMPLLTEDASSHEIDHLDMM